jgi:hypothetical protein
VLAAYRAFCCTGPPSQRGSLSIANHRVQHHYISIRGKIVLKLSTIVLNMRTFTPAAQQFADGLFGQTRGRILVLL